LALRLVVGLGNPGSRYAKTRHNVGFRLLSLGSDGPWKDFQGLGEIARAGDLLLGRPSTFMNESGRFVQAVSHFYKIPAGDMLICFDDVALPLGRLRIRLKGSSGGQKGMESIIRSMSTDAIPRLRVGVGPQPEGMDSAKFVLDNFSREQESALPKVLESAWDAVRTAASEGLETAMNRFNVNESDR
jgi:peptidyl-tRNA hydrolase, PTH1 family